MVSSSSATNPMDNAVMFCRTQFLRFTGPDLCKIGKITHFGLTSLKQKGDKRRHTQSKNHILYGQYSSSATNPMDNAAMFRRTQFLRFTGPDLCKIGKNHTFWAHLLKAQRGQTKTNKIKKQPSLWSIAAELQIPWTTQQCFVWPNFYVLQVRTCAK